MTQSLTEALAEAARTAATSGDLERDRVAWNLPRAAGEGSPADAREDRLDWASFSAAYFPGRRRHNLEAIVAYGAYRQSGIVDAGLADRAARSKRAAPSSRPTGPVDAWEDEGGATE